jgi:hypothetical protein
MLFSSMTDSHILRTLKGRSPSLKALIENITDYLQDKTSVVLCDWDGTVWDYHTARQNACYAVALQSDTKDPQAFSTPESVRKFTAKTIADTSKGTSLFRNGKEFSELLGGISEKPEWGFIVTTQSSLDAGKFPDLLCNGMIEENRKTLEEKGFDVAKIQEKLRKPFAITGNEVTEAAKQQFLDENGALTLDWLSDEADKEEIELLWSIPMYQKLFPSRWASEWLETDPMFQYKNFHILLAAMCCPPSCEFILMDDDLRSLESAETIKEKLLRDYGVNLRTIEAHNNNNISEDNAPNDVLFLRQLEALKNEVGRTAQKERKIESSEEKEEPAFSHRLMRFLTCTWGVKNAEQAEPDRQNEPEQSAWVHMLKGLEYAGKRAPLPFSLGR